MADRKLQYVIELIANDTKLRQQMAKWDWEDIMGTKGKNFGEILGNEAEYGVDKIKRAFNGLDVDWTQILGIKQMSQLEQALTRSLAKNRKTIEAFVANGDTSGIEKTVDLVASLGKEMASLGSGFNVDSLARGMTAFMKVISQYGEQVNKIRSSFTTLFDGKMMNGASQSFEKIATAMASLGIDKSAITNMNQVSAKLDEISKKSKIKLDIDYNDKNLSEKDLIAKLQQSTKTKYGNLKELLNEEWVNLTMGLPDIDPGKNNENLIKQLTTIVELEKKIRSLTGKSPINEYFYEDTGYAGIGEIKETLKGLTGETNAAVKETIKQLDQGVKTIQATITEKLGELSAVKINLTLDEANKTQFKSSIDTFVAELNSNKYGEIAPVKVDLNLNKTENGIKKGKVTLAKKGAIEETKLQIQKELDKTKEEYDKLDDLLNNEKTGLKAKSKKNPTNTRLIGRINRTKEELDSLKKAMISYEYLLSNMDDREFASAAVSDWKRFSSAAQNIRISQDTLLKETRRWSNEMNELLRFKYIWNDNGLEAEFDKLANQLTSISENKPIKLNPDIQYMIDVIEAGLSGREINVKLATDGVAVSGGIVGNLGVIPTGKIPPIVPSSKETNTLPPLKSQTHIPTANPTTEPQMNTYIDTDINEVIKFVEEQVESAKIINEKYAELLNEAGITSSEVSSYVKKIKEARTKNPNDDTLPKENFITRLSKYKEKSSSIAKSPFYNVANEILSLKDVINNNLEDEEKVKNATEQVKSLLVKSVVDSFKTYISKSKERLVSNKKKIEEETKKRDEAIQAYSSDDEKKKRLDKINTKKQEIEALESNTAISEYEKLLELIKKANKENDVASKNSFLKQERETLPSVKRGYQDLIEARKQLGLLYKEDPNDKNLLAIAESEQKIEQLQRRNEKINRSYKAYTRLGVPLDQFEELIKSGNNKDISDFVINKILGNNDIVNSMGPKTRTSSMLNPMYLFDTTYQKLITNTVDMVQKAFNMSQKAIDELNTRAMNENLLGDVVSISKKKTVLSDIMSLSNPSMETLELAKTLFSGDFKRISENNRFSPETKQAYYNFEQALNNAISKNDEASIKKLQDSIKPPADEKTGKSDQYSILGQISKQLTGYVFTVRLADGNDAKTLGFGTENLVKKGNLSKPDKQFRSGSINASRALSELPEDLSEIEDIAFYKVRGKKYNQPSNVEKPIRNNGGKKTSNSVVLAEANNLIRRSRVLSDEGTNTVTAQEELEAANQALELATQELSATNDKINSITGGIDSQEYINILKNQRERIKNTPSDRMNSKKSSILPLTNETFAEADRMILDAQKKVGLANQIVNNPFDLELQKLFSGELPDDIRRISKVIQEINTLNNTLPASQEEQIQMQSKIQALQSEEKILRQSINQWASGIAKERDATIEKADQMKRGVAPDLAEDYHRQLVSLVNQVTSLSKQLEFESKQLEFESEQLESDPNNETLKTQIETSKTQIDTLKTQMQGIIKNISQLSTLYRDLVGEYGIKTKLSMAELVSRNPADKSLWGYFEDLPDSVPKMAELIQRDSELTRLIPTLPKDQRVAMEEERLNISREYEKERVKLLEWVNKYNVTNSEGFKKAQAMVSGWTGKETVPTKTVDDRQERDRINDQISTLNNLERQAEAEKRNVELKSERVSLAKRQLEIEKELAATNITTERKSELETELATNRARALELGAKYKTYNTTPIDSQELQNAYLEVINDFINKQEESDKRIIEINADLARQRKILGALEAERTELAVKRGKRHTQDSAIEREIKFRADNLATTNPEKYSTLRQEAETENPIIDFYDYQNPYEHQERAIQQALSLKAEAYVRTTITEEEERKIIDEAIAAQKRNIEQTEARLSAERTYNNEIVGLREAHKAEGQITDEMINARRNATEEIRREAQIIRNSTTEAMSANNNVEYENDEINKSMGIDTDTNYQNYMGSQTYQYANGVYALDTSMLAKESTLSAIYALLSGDVSRAGLSDTERKALEDERAAIRNQLGELGNNDDVPEIRPMDRTGVADELQMVGEAENAAKTLQNALSKVDLRSSAATLANTYNAFGQDVFEAEKLLRSSKYTSALEIAKEASMGLEDFPDVNNLLAKMEKLRAKVGQEATASIVPEKGTTTSEKHVISRAMSVGQAIKIIDNALKSSNSNKTSDKAKVYANKIRKSEPAREAEKVLMGTDKFTSATGKQIKNKLLAYQNAYNQIQASKNKSAEKPVAEKTEYQKAVETVRNAVANFDMRSGNEKKANLYNSFGQEIKDAATVLRTTADGVTKEGNNLLDKMNKLQSAADAQKEAGSIDGDKKVKRTLPNGSPFKGTEKDYNDMVALLSEQSADVNVKPKVEPGTVDRAIDEDAAQNPPDTIFKATLENGTPIEGTKETIQEFSDLLGSPIKEMVELGEQQVKNEQMKSAEGEKQVENEKTETVESNKQVENGKNQLNYFESLKAREAEITSRLLEDDNLKTAKNIDISKQNGLIGVINNLAKDSTLREVLNAINEVAKRQVASISGKGNSAQDLLMRIAGLRDVSIGQGKERVAYIDLNTGAMTDSIEGLRGSINNDTLNVLRKAYQGLIDFNAQVHTHGDSNNPEDQYFSKKDFQTFKSDFDNGIKKQILVSTKGLSVLDLSDVKNLSNDTLTGFGGGKAAYEALLNNNLGIRYVTQAWENITPQGLIKLLGIKGIESKYSADETRDNAVKSMLAEDAKEAADILQESTGRAVKKTVERVGPELMTSIEKIDTKGNKTWSKQIDNRYEKAAIATNKSFEKLNLDNQFGKGTEAQVALDNYTTLYKQFIELMNKFKANPNQEGLQEEFNQLLPKLDEAEIKLNKLIVARDKFLANKEPIAIFDDTKLSSVGDSLKSLAVSRYASGLGLGDNMATNGISETANGTRLLVDVLKNGTIQQYALEVDKATGQVKEFMIAETALANAFQNVNKAMKQNETVRADVAIGNSPDQQEKFMSEASSPMWNAYKKALSDMEGYVSGIWNRMANGGQEASQKELDYIMALSEKVITLGKEVQKTSVAFQDFWRQNPDKVTAMDIDIKTQGENVPTRDEQVRAALEKYAQTNAEANSSKYAFSSFDNNTLQYTLTDIEGNVRKVSLVWNELYKQVEIVSNKSVVALEPVVAKIDDYKNKLQQAIDSGYLSESDKNFTGFNNATMGIQNLINSVENGSMSFSEARDKLDQLRQEAIRFGEAANKTAKSNEKLYIGTNELKSAKTQNIKINNTFGEGLAESELPSVQNYNKAYNDLIALYDRLKAEQKLFDTAEQENLRQQAMKVQDIGTKLLANIKQSETLRRSVENSGSYTNNKGEEIRLGGIKENLSAEEVQVNNLKATMIDFAKNGLNHANMESIKFNKNTQTLTYNQRINKETVAAMAITYDEYSKSLYAANKGEKESLTGWKGFMKDIKGKGRSIFSYLTYTTSIYRLISVVRQGVAYVKEIDSAMTELRKVTDETEETYAKFLDTASKTASKVGSTTKDVVSSTADWARLGYSIQEAAQLAESTQILMNVSEFTDVSTATDSLISSIQAFKYTAEESMDVVDILNTIGKQYCRCT